jgi:hypothetical protein
MDVIVKDNRPSVFDAFVFFFFFFPNWVLHVKEKPGRQHPTPTVLENERVGTKTPPWRKNAASSSNQSMEAAFFIHN